MFERNLYIYVYKELIMGAAEALRFLSVLRKHGLLSRQNVAQYVLYPLYAGPEIREGTPAYQAFEESVYRKVIARMLGDELETDNAGPDMLSPEAGDYLRRVFASICDRKNGLSRFDGPYNGYSKEAYQEVRNLLGSRGIRYLGISNVLNRLNPSRSRISAILTDEDDMTQQSEAETYGPESMLNDLKKWMPDDTLPGENGQAGVPEQNTQGIGYPNEPFPGSIIPLEHVRAYNRQ